jgi:2-oxoglutarate dehydrogenase E2 component (dihydrolipoamide succinyltransferase)
MAIEVKVPVLPESVADATVSNWYKNPGDSVKRNENLVDIETDKVMLEVPAPADGVLKEIKRASGSTVLANEVIAVIEPGAAQAKPAEVKPAEAKPAEAAKPAAAPVAETKAAPIPLSPSARRAAAEHEVDTTSVQGTGKEGRVTKEDIVRHSQTQTSAASATTVEMSPLFNGERIEKRVPMTRLRARIAERLLESQQTTATLTTFNEINLKPIMDIRNRYKDEFQKVHGIKLGFMSFFVKASVEALKRFPSVNASIDGNDVVYHGYFDIGVAVSTDRGLVVPILRNADQMSLADIEKTIAEFGEKARTNKLSIEEMTGGTFTVSNGGVFGSLLSTPILNPPQSAILGMHKTEDRPVVENGQIVIRPMMYVAMSYDHRIIDGRESVTFLRTIKEFLEDPTRLLLDL